MAANERRAERVADRVAHPGPPLARFLIFCFALLLGALREGLIRQPAAYLLPGVAPSLDAVRLGALAAALVVGIVTWRRRAGFRSLVHALCALSLTLSLSGPAWFESFSFPIAAWFVAWLVPAALLGLIALVLTSCARSLGRSARSLEVLSYALNPFRVFTALLVLILGSVLGSVCGFWRSAAILGILSAILAFHAPALKSFAVARSGRKPIATPPIIAFVVAVASFSFALVRVPNAQLDKYPGEIVFASSGPAEFVITSVQQSFEVYRGRVLRLATVDAKRYAECSTHPALALAPSRHEVLILGSADGLAEREALAYPDVAHLTSVSDDLSLAHLVRKNQFFAQLTGHSLDSPRLSLVAAEALPWLAGSSQLFDVIIVDLPDPSDYLQGKNYSHFFYETLRAHLSPTGLLVTQATSNTSSPGAFASIAATVSSAGFSVHSYATPIPTLGEWAFLLASPGPWSTPKPDAVAQRILASNQFLSARTLELLLATGPALPVTAPQNTLNEQPVVELLNEERRERGL